MKLVSLKEWEKLCPVYNTVCNEVTKCLAQVLEQSTLDQRINNLRKLLDSIQAAEMASEQIYLKQLAEQARQLLEVLSQARSGFMQDQPLAMQESYNKENGKGVLYLSDVEREQYRVIPYQGKLWQIKNNPDGSLALVVFNSKQVNNTRFNLDVSGKKIFVETPEHDLFFGDSMQFNHSSFNEGKPVLMAGEAIVEDGGITYMSNKSGHYLPSFERFVENLNNYVHLDILTPKSKLHDEEQNRDIQAQTIIDLQAQRLAKQALLKDEFKTCVDSIDNYLLSRKKLDKDKMASLLKLKSQITHTANAYFQQPHRSNYEQTILQKELSGYYNEANKILSVHSSRTWLRIARKFTLAISALPTLGLSLGAKAIYSKITTGSATVFNDKTRSSKAIKPLANLIKQLDSQEIAAPLIKQA